MTEITDKRFERLVAAYGADPARWPATERAAAAACASEPEGAAALAVAVRLDSRLDALPPVMLASRPLLDRLLAIADRPAQLVGWSRRILDSLGGLASPGALVGEAAAFAAALLAGLWFGAGSMQADVVDLSPYLLGAQMELLDENGQ